jgi:hypothetical protein
LKPLVGRSLKATLPIFAKTKYLRGGEIKHAFYNYFLHPFFIFTKKPQPGPQNFGWVRASDLFHGFYSFVWNPRFRKGNDTNVYGNALKVHRENKGEVGTGTVPYPTRLWTDIQG